MRAERRVWRLVAAFLLLAAAAPARAILPIQHWQTPGGARVYFVENHDLPMVDISVEFPAGAAYDVNRTSGAANMTHRLLRLGAEGMDENDIARGIADVGAELAGNFNTDRAGLSLRTLSSRAERSRALEIMARLLQRPLFPEAVLEREKARLIAALREVDTRPDTIAGRTFFRMLYRDHPYAHRSTGEIETVQKLTRQDLVDFHRRHYVGDRAVVAIVGDLTRIEAERIAEQLTTLGHVAITADDGDDALALFDHDRRVAERDAARAEGRPRRTRPAVAHAAIWASHRPVPPCADGRRRETSTTPAPR